MSRQAEPLMERILRRIEIDLVTGCWLHPSVSGSGYATIVVGSRRDGTRSTRSVHRLMYELLVGPISHTIDHVHTRGCRYRNCCNPDHLEDVTYSENERRKHALRTECPRGHARTPENKRPGRSDCKLCHREDERNRRHYTKEVHV